MMPAICFWFRDVTAAVCHLFESHGASVKKMSMYTNIPTSQVVSNIKTDYPFPTC